MTHNHGSNQHSFGPRTSIHPNLRTPHVFHAFHARSTGVPGEHGGRRSRIGHVWSAQRTKNTQCRRNERPQQGSKRPFFEATMLKDCCLAHPKGWDEIKLRILECKRRHECIRTVRRSKHWMLVYVFSSGFAGFFPLF